MPIAIVLVLFLLIILYVSDNESTPKNPEPRVNIILKHLFLHGPIFLVLLFVYMFSFVLKFCLCVEQKYMHIAIVVLLFLLHILSLSSFLIPFLTHCKQLLFTENKIIYCWISKTVQNQYNKWIKEATWKQSDVKWSLIQWRETDEWIKSKPPTAYPHAIKYQGTHAKQVDPVQCQTSNRSNQPNHINHPNQSIH